MRWALIPARWMQKLRLDRLFERIGATRLLPARLQRMQAQLPELQTPLPELPGFLPAKGNRRARVALFIGCVADAMFRHVHWATARVLQENGCDVVIPSSQVCRALPLSQRCVSAALGPMRQNMAAFQDPTLDAVIVNVAGCGAMLKYYAHIAEELNGGRSDEASTVHCRWPKRFSVHAFVMYTNFWSLGPIRLKVELTVVYQVHAICRCPANQRTAP